MIEVLCAETGEPNALPGRPVYVLAARIGLIACSCKKDSISWLDVQLNYFRVYPRATLGMSNSLLLRYCVFFMRTYVIVYKNRITPLSQS